MGIFSEVEPQQFSLTDMAEFLRSDRQDSLRALAMTTGSEWSWACCGDLLNIVKSGQPAMQHLYQIDDTYEYLAQNPDDGSTFSDAMTGWSRKIHTAALDAYDFSGIQKLVDIAGGYGALISSILAKHSQMQGILFDLPQVVAGSKSLLEDVGVHDRCEIVGGNFFDAIPAGGDAYVMSHILHNWGDEDCIRILKQIRKSMDRDSKLLILEMVVPDGNVSHFSKVLDVVMLVLFAEARERTEAEYNQLFQLTGFKLNRVIPTMSPVSILEVY